MSSASGCTNSAAITSIEPVSTIWSTQSVHPSLPNNCELHTSATSTEAVGLKSHSTLCATRNLWYNDTSGIKEAGLQRLDQFDISKHAGCPRAFSGPCAAPYGICLVLEGHKTLGVNDVSYAAVRVTCVTTGCNYGGPLHQVCLHRWQSCCDLKCRLLFSTVRSSGIDDQKHPQATICNDNSAGIIEELFSLYLCPRCGQCSLCRISSEGQLLPVAEDPLASMLNVVQYVNHQLNAAPTSIQDPSTHNVSTQPGPNFALGTAENTDTKHTSHHGLSKPSNESLSHIIAAPNDRCDIWSQDWKTGLVYSLYPPIQSLRQLSLNPGSRTDNFAAAAAAFDSGLSSTMHSVESSRRSSDNASNLETSYETNHHDDGCWSAPPSAPRALRGAGRGAIRSGSKTDNYFSFDRLSPVQSESPASGLCESNETVDCNLASPSLSHQSKQWVGAEEATGEHGAGTLGLAAHSTGGRKHTSGGSRGLSFWPSEKCRETPNDPSDRRKVVNRKGNIFQPRMSFNVFERLPAYKRNPYFIHMDDDSCTGNEDTRAFLLAQLTNHRMSEVYCLICQRALVIYDHFPVIDGLFFLSPICHRSGRAGGLRVNWHTSGIAPTFYQTNVLGANCDPEIFAKNELSERLLGSAKSVVPPPGCLGPRQQVSVGHLSDQMTYGASGSRGHSHPPRQERYLHAVCMECMHAAVNEQKESGTKVRCRTCDCPWSGSNLLVGGLYTYDIFAASPCCTKQLTCNACDGRLDMIEKPSQGGSTIPTSSSQASSFQGVKDSTAQGSQVLQGSATKSTLPPNDSNRLTNFPLPFFSQYSQLITCLFCARTDYHFVKPFEKRYHTQPSN